MSAEGLSAEERGAWWWLLLHERATLWQNIVCRTVCRARGHAWEHYRGDWEEDAHAYNPDTESWSCLRCGHYTIDNPAHPATPGGEGR